MIASEERKLQYMYYVARCLQEDKYPTLLQHWIRHIEDVEEELTQGDKH